MLSRATSAGDIDQRCVTTDSGVLEMMNASIVIVQPAGGGTRDLPPEKLTPGLGSFCG
jgi:hypothetical protein